MSRSATTVARSPESADARARARARREPEYPREERERLLREWEQRAERAEASERRAETHARERAQRVERDTAGAAGVLDDVPAPAPAPAPAPSRPRRAAETWDHVMEPPAERGRSGRQTVTITGHGVDGYFDRRGTRASSAQRHQAIKRHERAGFRPDRVAMWAVMLGVILMLAAAASSHAAVLAHHLAH